MPYRHLLFDADNTLLDFDACEEYALKKLFLENGLEFTRETLAAYRETNEGLWRALERGELSQQELLDTRFQAAFARLGVRRDGRACEERYRILLGEGDFLVPGAKELCQGLFSAHTLWIVTNGISGTQRSRLARSGLAPYFEGYFISGEMGVQKPQREYFDRVLIHLGNPPREEVLLVGDSLTSDIRGGCESGIPTCWFNPKGRERTGPWAPDYEIRELSELLPLVEGASMAPAAQEVGV